MWWNTLKLGVKNLLLHKLRSMLTVLGVILGVASVIAMLAIGEGSKREALERIKNLGASNVIVRSVKPNANEEEDDSASATGGQGLFRVVEYGLTYKDYERLAGTLPTLKRSLPIALRRKDAQHGSRRIPNARVLGITGDFLNVKNLKIARGRIFTAGDLTKATNVAVLGSGAAKRLFSYKDPLNQTVLLGEDVYRVVGVLAGSDSGNAMSGGVGRIDHNNEIYIPLSAARNRFGELQVIRNSGGTNFERTELDEITLTVTDIDLVTQTAAMVRKLLRRDHPRGDDIELVIPAELLEQAEQEKRIWNLVLGSIAGISLLVGGIGIMNIMLATVTERTREIGIRRALGATKRDITKQFLVETVVLSSTGGILGVLLGIAVPLVVTYYAGLETVLSAWSIGLAFGISTVIGIVFGLYPAQRAASMDPIEALRHE